MLVVSVVVWLDVSVVVTVLVSLDVPVDVPLEVGLDVADDVQSDAADDVGPDKDMNDTDAIIEIDCYFPDRWDDVEEDVSAEATIVLELQDRRLQQGRQEAGTASYHDAAAGFHM